MKPSARHGEHARRQLWLSFSAVGYFFARDLQEHQHIPIGVIDDTWGGTIAEAWTSLDALSANASLMPVFAWRAKLMDALPTILLQQKQEQQEIENAKAAGKPDTGISVASGSRFMETSRVV